MKQEIESDPRLNLTIPKKLIAPDPIVLKAKDSLTKRMKDRYYSEGIVDTDSYQINIGVSKRHIELALRLMDVIVKGLKVRGHTFHFEYDISYVIIYGQRIEMSLIEKSKRFEINKSEWDKYEWKLTGNLSFRIRRNFRTKEWIDGKILLEDRISAILATLEVEGKKMKLQQEELERMWEIQRQKDELRKQQSERREKEFLAVKKLVADAERWHRTNIVRQYIDAIAANGRIEDYPTNDLGVWVAWARKKADWLDPTIGKYDELLPDVDPSKAL